MWHELLTAFGLVLVIEGILPFLSPERLRKTMSLAIQLDDSTLRGIGLASMIAGLLIIYLVD
jgi:hypothetical protein